MCKYIITLNGKIYLLNSKPFNGEVSMYLELSSLDKKFLEDLVNGQTRTVCEVIRTSKLNDNHTEKDIAEIKNHILSQLAFLNKNPFFTQPGGIDLMMKTVNNLYEYVQTNL